MGASSHVSPSPLPPDSAVDSSGAPALPLLDELLHEQATLSAVEQFSRAYESGVPDQAKYYSRLLPSAPPQEGQQYAFAVDLDRCSGCKACVTACHSLNGLDDEETWRDVGLLIGGSVSAPVIQHVTTSCHHCLEPACASACPVDAYDKDPVTGIVRHRDDQCFGCQYCTLACPYDVPQYHAGKGIVRKCDMCRDRLAANEAPACVQACPHEAIAITVVDRQQVVEDAETDFFLPAAPDPQFTLPTTQYTTRRLFPRNTLPADYRSVSPQHLHWPRIIMLVLTQLSVGAFIVGLVLETRFDASLLTAFRRQHATTALIFGLLALGASTLHLGRPQYAFRAVIGLRHSWLSREIVAFGVFAAAAVLYALVCWMQPSGAVVRAAGWMVAVSGSLGIFCSVMIYVVTGRDLWRFGPTMVRFVLTAAVLGIATTWLSLLLFGLFVDAETAVRLSAEAGPILVRALLPAAGLKLLLEASVFRHLLFRRESPLKRSARLMAVPLSASTFARFSTGLLGGIVMPLFLWTELSAPSPRSLLITIIVSMLVLSCLAGELLARFQFFAACVAPRMPGRV